MKRLVFVLIALFLIKYSQAQVLTPIDAESNIEFSIKNFGMQTKGTIKGLQGKIEFNAQKLATSYFNVSLDANSVNTNNSSRDKHLKKADYFDVAKHPTITFTSTKISTTATANTFVVEGNLTLKGITKFISFNFIPTPQKSGYLFTGDIKINRRDFTIGGSSLVLSDYLSIKLSVIAR